MKKKKIEKQKKKGRAVSHEGDSKVVEYAGVKGGSRNDLKECLVQKVTGSEQVTFPVSPRGIKTDF